MADKDPKKVQVSQDIKKARITFSGNKLQSMQQVTNQLVNRAKTNIIKITGPVRLPNKHLRISCRRTPCGQGSKTWDNYQMTIYKRYIDLECTTLQIKSVTTFTIPSGVDITVDVKKDQ